MASTAQNRVQKEKIFWDSYWKDKIAYYKKYNEIFEIRNKWGFFCNEELHQHYKSLIGSFSGLSAIEYGCGSGYNSCLMAQEGANVVVLDVSHYAIEYAKIVADRLGVSDEMKFVCGDIFSFKEERKFDLSWNCGVIEHYSDPEIILIIKKMIAATKLNGKILITVPNLTSPEGIYRLYKDIVTRREISERIITRRRLKRLMEFAGLKEVRTVALNYFLPSFFPPQFANFMRQFRIVEFIKPLSWLLTGMGTVKNG